MNKLALDRLDNLMKMTTQYINSGQFKHKKRVQPIVDIFSANNSGAAYKKDDDIITLAKKGSRKHRIALRQLIFEYIASINGLKEKDIDCILEGYYINYYGTVEDLTSSSDIRLFTDFINKILIPRKSDPEVKMKKLAQVVFQELYGIGLLDEFLDFKPDESLKKVEDINYSGFDDCYLKISGVTVKLDKVVYSPVAVKKLCLRLLENSNKNLTSKNPKVETDLLDGSRVNLTQPPYGSGYTANIRRHYGSSITKTKLVELGSTTWEFEAFKDIVMNFRPRLLIVGPQGVGKSTIIGGLCERFPRNTTVVTGETSFELGLKRIKKLNVIETRTDVLEPEKYLESLFRFAADCLVLGEARTASDVMIYTQMAKRQAYGTISTWHASDCLAGIDEMAKAYLRGGYATNEYEALKELCDCVDFIINPNVCDEKYGDKTGLRHVAEVCEVPKIKSGFNGDLKLRTLFKFDYNTFELKNVNPISDEMAQILLKRAYLPKEMEVLKSGKYI